MSKLQEGNCALEANEQRQLPIYRTHTNGELEEVSMIKRFDKVDGSYVEKLYGQDRYGYSKSDTIDFYDLVELAKEGISRGSVVLIYDFEKGKVYTPFEKQNNIVYGDPVYVEKFIYFLQCDYNKKRISLYRYLPEKILEKVAELNLDDLNPYNLHIVGNPLYIISQEAGEGFRCYYPTEFFFPLKHNESVIFIEDGKVYIEAWIEEGWDDENNCATDDYKYYDKIIVKDFAGNKISEEVGCLNKGPDGNWWIS